MERAYGYARLLAVPGTLVVSPTITVYDAGTLTLSTIYDDNLATPTPKANPFTADQYGFWYFYAADGRYDVKASSGTPALTPYTLGDLLLDDSAAAGQGSGAKQLLALDFEPRWGADAPGGSGGNSVTESCFAETIRRGGIINLVTGYEESHTADDYSTTAKFGSYSLQLGSGKSVAVPVDPRYFNFDHGFLSFWIEQAIGASRTVFELPGIVLSTNGSGQLLVTVTSRTTASQTAKTTATITSTTTFTAGSTFKHILVTWDQLNSGSANASVHLYIDGVEEGTAVSGVALPLNYSAPIYVGRARLNPTWTKFSAMAVLPSAESSSPWTLTETGAPAAASVSGGVLSMRTDLSQTQYFSRTSPLTKAAGWTVEGKFHCPGRQGQNIEDPNSGMTLLEVQDDVHSLRIEATDDLVWIRDLKAGGGETRIYGIDLPLVSYWSTIRCVLAAGSDNVQIWVDGMPLATSSGNTDILLPLTAGVNASPVIIFGDQSATSGANLDLQVEYFAYASTPQVPMPTGVAQARIDGVAIGSWVPTAAQRTALQTNPAETALNITSVVRGPTRPLARMAVVSTPTHSSVTMQQIPDMLQFLPSDGMTPWWCAFECVIGQSQGVVETLTAQYQHDGDGAATDATSERPFLSLPAICNIAAAYFIPRAALTASDADYATLILRKRDSNGGGSTTIASQTTRITGGSGNWTAFDAVSLGAITGGSDVPLDYILSFEITKTGSGVVVPPGMLIVQYSIDGGGDSFCDFNIYVLNIDGRPIASDADRVTVQRGNVNEDKSISHLRMRFPTIGLNRFSARWAVNAGVNQGIITGVARQRRLTAFPILTS